MNTKWNLIPPTVKYQRIKALVEMAIIPVIVACAVVLAAAESEMSIRSALRECQSIVRRIIRGHSYEEKMQTQMSKQIAMDIDSLAHERKRS